jgi:5'-nucleotidase
MKFLWQGVGAYVRVKPPLKNLFMQILLTNDDGIYAEGVAALAKTLARVGVVTVVAPDSERSAVSHGITLAHPIWFKKVKRRNRFFGYGISGTPADCVKFGVGVILKKKPDLVVSGVNQGDNDGCSVFYSGTVAGAREGALLGIPSIAISLASFDSNADFRYAAEFGARLAKKVFQEGLPGETFLNVNVPDKKASQIKGVRVTRQGMTPIHCEFRRRFDPNLREYYWMTGKVPQRKKDLSIDTYALHQGYVTLTPVHCNLTDERVIQDITEWGLKK